MKNKRALIKAVIFDLDGTLIDSEPVYFESEKIWLGGYGIDYSEEMNHKYLGRGSAAMIADLLAMFPDSAMAKFGIEELVRQKDKAYLELAPRMVKTFPQVLSFANILYKNGTAMAIASGSTLKVINSMAESLGFKHYFPFIVSAEEVKTGKPAPDIFLETARRMAVEPENCLVLEDSKNGVLSAKAAGMHCVVLPDPELPFFAEQELADILVKGGPMGFMPDTVLSAFNWKA
ncbi:HAD family phosphatase [Spirochaetota bacterium]